MVFLNNPPLVLVVAPRHYLFPLVVVRELEAMYDVEFSVRWHSKNSICGMSPDFIVVIGEQDEYVGYSIRPMLANGGSLLEFD